MICFVEILITLQKFIHRFHDVKAPGKVKRERVLASGPRKAFEKFITNRIKEKWSLPEIFIKSRIRILDLKARKVYQIDSRGEVKQIETK